MAVNVTDTTGYSAMDLIKQRKAEILKKLKNGETEDKVQIGACSLTKTEWDKMMKKVDHAIEDSKKEAEEQKEENKKAKEKEKEKQAETISDTYEKLASSSLLIKAKLKEDNTSELV